MNRISIRVATTLATVGLAATIGGCLPASEEGPPASRDKTESSLPTVAISSDSVIDRNNQRAVAGFATDIFFGLVTAPAPTGNTEKRGVLETQYKVQVTERLKGSATGVVTVNQTGGEKGGKVFLPQGDALLLADREYLFATRFSNSEKWFTLVPVVGNIPVTDSPNSSAVGRRVARDKSQARAQMQSSIASAIPFAGPAGTPQTPASPSVSTPSLGASPSTSTPPATTSGSPAPTG